MVLVEARGSIAASAGRFIRSCVQNESILTVNMPIRIGPFYPLMPQGERVYILLNAD